MDQYQYQYHIERLRASGLRPTKQRIALCKILFDRKETFHFTIEKLKKIIDKGNKKKFLLQHYTIQFMHLKKKVT